MNFRQKITLSLLLTFVLGGVAFAQPVHITDPNLRTAIVDALKLPRGTHVTEEHMLSLTELDVRSRGIYDIKGLEFAINLTYLRIADNPISDLRPIAGLTKLKTLILGSVPDADINVLDHLINLEHFDISHCNVQNIDVVKHFKQLVILSISFNSVVDISPVANLRQLQYFWAVDNNIVNIEALSKLHNLRALDIYRNQIINHSPVDGLSLTHFAYDQVCEMLPAPLEQRLSRNYPTLSGGTFINKPALSPMQNFAQNDLVFAGAGLFGVDLRHTKNGFDIAGPDIEHSKQVRDAYLALNPNMVFLVDLEFRAALYEEYPADWPYWLRDAQGKIVDAGENDGFINFTHPVIQDRIVQRALAFARCGLYDGVMFDFWNEHHAILVDESTWPDGYVGNEAEQRARDNILARIRANTRPNFIIAGNVNITTIPRTGAMLNGATMETVFPDAATPEDIEYELKNIEHTLLWLDSNIRAPRITILDGRLIPTQSPFSPDNLRWVRALTTLSLTHSDGYFTIKQFTPAGEWGRYWYDFWDADLGQPVGEKGQLYQGREGLYIREYTNGWAVYNHSGSPQVIRLPEEVQGVASGLVNVEHALPNLDGEMYLKAVESGEGRVVSKNPADVNGDGVVNILDLTLVAQSFGSNAAEADVNGDGVVNVFDLVFVANEF